MTTDAEPIKPPTAPTPTLYRFYDTDDTLLYVGRTVNPVLRFEDHRKTRFWWGEAARIKLQHFDSLEELDAAERHAIKTEHPKYNWAGNPRPRSSVSEALSEAGRAFSAARVAEREARKKVTAAALQEIANGASEVAVSKAVGVDRLTIRRWQGK